MRLAPGPSSILRAAPNGAAQRRCWHSPLQTKRRAKTRAKMPHPCPLAWPRPALPNRAQWPHPKDPASAQKAPLGHAPRARCPKRCTCAWPAARPSRAWPWAAKSAGSVAHPCAVPNPTHAAPRSRCKGCAAKGKNQMSAPVKAARRGDPQGVGTSHPQATRRARRPGLANVARGDRADQGPSTTRPHNKKSRPSNAPNARAWLRPGPRPVPLALDQRHPHPPR